MLAYPSPGHLDPRQIEARSRLVNAIDDWTSTNDSPATAIAELSLFRVQASTSPSSWTYEPSIALIAQGTKRVTLGEESFHYGPSQFLLTSIELPTITQVLEATPETPYLSLLLKLDLKLAAQLMVDSNVAAPRATRSDLGMALGDVTAPLLTSLTRLIELLADPRDIPVVAPLIQREILYRVLISEQGGRLRQMASIGSQGHKIGQAVEWIKEHFHQPLRIEDMAAQIQMSASTFHHHFRALTSMTPLQYQKSLRLNEARRLMLIDYLDVGTAAFRVGYESPTQFGREYSRLFGASPLRDIASIRASNSP